MDQNRDQLSNNRYGIFSLWLFWVIGTGAVVAAVLLSKVCSPQLYPIVCLAICFLLYALVRRNRQAASPVCGLIPFVVARAMLWSSLVMMAINLMHRRSYLDLIFVDVKLLNPDIPFVPIMIIAPLLMVSSGIACWRKERFGFCVECQRRTGIAAERGYLGSFFAREGRAQEQLLLLLSGTITAFSGFYYFAFYTNVNINATDTFNFVVGPVVLIMASMVYLWFKYQSLWIYFRLNYGDDHSHIGRTTRVRYLILCGEELMLRTPDDDDDDIDSLETLDSRIDTPVSLTVRRKDTVTLEQALTYFRNLTDIKGDIDIRFLYSNTTENADFNIFHYLVVLPSKDVLEGSRVRGEWFRLPQVVEIVNTHACVPLLAAEIMRLVNMVMTWKVYDREGMRRYPIKNYRPMFRLSDLAETKVDFNDRLWLHIADHNQDQPFFRLRRFWSRYVSRSAR